MNKANKKIKVLCTMSGGVDSSVAAALLVAKGYDVTGAFMVNYDEIGPNGESCWAADYQDALRVAAKLGIPLLRWDFVKEYKETVLDYMFSEYEKGRTPNPDILCNKFVKFGAWLDKAKELGFDKLATGHYARIKQSKKLVKLMEAKDKNKDQTYFLHQLNQDQLKHIIFPIGDYTKPEVRKLAKKFGLPNADKEESMGICFVGEVPMKDFLLKKIKSKPGKIILSTGETIGEHDGLSFYTIGQRNLGVKTKQNKPLYVVAKIFDKNELVVGYEDDPLLYNKEAEVAEINWVSEKPKLPLNCEVRLRHRQTLEKVKLEMKNKKVFLKFSKSQRAVTPGQFAVFYKKGECLGGAVIN
jgi:tRNA-specific 2-thiouridylase